MSQETQINNRVELIEFVLQEAEHQPVARRVKIYRGLAGICGDEMESRQLNMIADELDKTERRSAEFIFKFHQRTH
jgi:hypothetical protein